MTEPGNTRHLFELFIFTDPFCTWCWGSEPVLRKTRESYGDQVRFVFRMGGLVESVKDFNDTLNKINGKNFYQKMAEYWEMSSQRHKMPVDSRFFAEYKTDFRSSWPACLAVKAAQIQDEELAARYLRRLREAGLAECLPIHRRQTQVELAEETGLDGEQLKGDIDSGAAGHAFEADMQEYHTQGGEAFPFYVVRHMGGEEIPLNGYVSSMALEKLLEKMSGGKLERRQPELTDDNVVAFVEKYGKVAVREVGELYFIPIREAAERLDRLVEEGRLGKMKAGNGWFYLPPTAPAAPA
ncbi:DSBA-like thioredoxin domain protein [bacterium BMS3Abin01]|nr:DSBA-like thioredoxin domain protein [bacterium BMS3Abin01]